MSAKDYILNPTLNNLGLFENTKNIYVIPHYQRSYDWNKDRAVAFWEDLLMADNKTDFNLSFVGSIILKHNSEEDPKGQYELIDGQQRFITTSIFIALLRDYTKELIRNKYKFGERREDFEEIITGSEKMLRIKKRGKKEIEPRLRVGKIVREVYDKIIINSNGYENNLKMTFTSLKNPSEQNILRNYKTFNTLLKKHVEKNFKEDNEDEIINDLLNKLSDIDFIEITVTDDVAAYEIFETVNSQNEPLTSSDLVKNQILMRIKNPETYEEKWNESIININEVSGFNFNQFLRYYWISKYGWTTDKKLYANFKSYLTNEENVPKKDQNSFLIRFVDDLLENSVNLRRLTNPGFDNYYKETFAGPSLYDEKIIRSLKNIGKLNVKQCYVLLLSLLRNVNKAKKGLKDKSKFEKIAKAFAYIVRNIETFSLHFHVLGKGQANKVEKNVYHEIALHIEHELITEEQDSVYIKKWTSTLRSKIKTKLDTIIKDENIDMRNAISKLDYSKKMDYNIIKFIYELINQYVYGQKNFSFNEFSTQEHILPQNPIKWGLDRAEIEGFVNSIGNIIIIEKELNKLLGNKTLEDKIYGFKNSKGDKISYFNDTCPYNLALYEQIKSDLPKYENNGKKYWTASKIESRVSEIVNDFSSALESYNNDK